MNQNVPGQTTVYVSFLYGLELPCQKAKKSLQRFSGKSGNYRPGIRRRTIQTLTSTDVENSSSLWANILRTQPLIDMRFSREVR